MLKQGGDNEQGGRGEGSGPTTDEDVGEPQHVGGGYESTATSSVDCAKEREAAIAAAGCLPAACSQGDAQPPSRPFTGDFVAPPLHSGTMLLAQAAHHKSKCLAHERSPQVTPPTAPREAPMSPTSVGSHGKGRKRGVPHVYHDYSSVPDAAGFVRKKTGGVTQPFPEKLHELLTNETDAQSIVGWLPHGRAFIVRRPKEFTEVIMPKYFRQTKLTSFQRQLNLYGFRRITQGADAGAYYHELFLRGRPQLCMRMVRQKIKGTGHKQPADAQTEPNFYAMPAQPSGSLNPSPWPEEEQKGSQSPDSPGLQGVHGAAHLLKGIAAGLPASRLSVAPFLGEPATGSSNTAGSRSTSTAGLYSQTPNFASSTAAESSSGHTFYATMPSSASAPADSQPESFVWPQGSSTTQSQAKEKPAAEDDSGSSSRRQTFLTQTPNPQEV